MSIVIPDWSTVQNPSRSPQGRHNSLLLLLLLLLRSWLLFTLWMDAPHTASHTFPSLTRRAARR